MNKTKFIAVVAVSLDGKIARFTHEKSTSWTSPEDKKFLFQKLNRSDLIIIGRKTYQMSVKALRKRKCLVLTTQVKTLKKINQNCFYCNPANVNLKKTILKFGPKTVAILGGTKTYSLMLKEKLIDEIYLTVEPIVFGYGFNIFELELPLIFFNLISIKKLNSKGSILLHYSKIKP